MACNYRCGGEHSYIHNIITIVEGTAMNPELLGMSNEELMQWACKHGAINENTLRAAFPGIECHCAVYPIGIGTFIERVVSLVNTGMGVHRAIRCMKREKT